MKEGRLDEYNVLLNCINNPFHVLAFTETWLRSDNLHNVEFEGYDSSHVIRPVDDHFDGKNSGGGISVFIKEGLHYKVRTDLNFVLPYLETLFVELTFNNKLYMIGVVYRVPNTDVDTFNETLNGIIEPLRNIYELILLGDFNVCLMKDNNQTNHFRNSLISNNLFPTILEPTRIATLQRNGEYITTESLIDNIFINTQLKFQSGLIDSSISDHFPIFISLQIDSPSQTEDLQTIKYRNIDEFSIKKFNFALSISLPSLLDGISDPQESFTIFYNLINDLYDKYFPIKTKILSKKSQSKPWVSQTLINRIKIRDRLNKLSCKGRIDRKNYTKFRNCLTKQLRDAKAIYFSHKFDKCRSSIKKNIGNY